MVMAGTGEISCLRRLQFAYGMYHQTMYHRSFKYGIHITTHMSLGLLFLGGGRFTLVKRPGFDRVSFSLEETFEDSAASADPGSEGGSPLSTRVVASRPDFV
jgi:hypothetical protein